jgi:polyphosphate kinase 2
MAAADFPKPFDGAISRYLAEGAPKDVRKAIEKAGKKDILNPDYPYREVMDKDAYEAEYEGLQIEIARMQGWLRESGERIAIVFEGRDAAGKGGAIERFIQNLNPRGARVVALSKPSDVERTQWYFQRYVQHLPAAGEIVFFDRSWYNRAVVEPVFGFCSPPDREAFFEQVGAFEDLLVKDGIRLFKIWLTVGRAEQLRRFLERESDPLKQWKLSRIDVDGLAKWDDYTAAITEMFRRTHLPVAPWTVVQSDDQRRARLAAIRAVLSALPVPGGKAGRPDPKLVGAPRDFGLV